MAMEYTYSTLRVFLLCALLFCTPQTLQRRVKRKVEEHVDTMLAKNREGSFGARNLLSAATLEDALGHEEATFDENLSLQEELAGQVRRSPSPRANKTDDRSPSPEQKSPSPVTGPSFEFRKSPSPMTTTASVSPRKSPCPVEKRPESPEKSPAVTTEPVPESHDDDYERGVVMGIAISALLLLVVLIVLVILLLCRFLVIPSQNRTHYVAVPNDPPFISIHGDTSPTISHYRMEKHN